MKKRKKSPAAPRLSLGEAIDYMAQLEEDYGKGNIRVWEAAQVIAKGHASVKARQTLGSLRMYGLL